MQIIKGNKLRSTLGAIVSVMAMQVGCPSSDDSGGSAGESGSSSESCSSEHTQYAECESDSDCYSGECQDGTHSKICYGGNGKGASCSSDDDCAAVTPSPAASMSSAMPGEYYSFCAGGGCVVYCKD